MPYRIPKLTRYQRCPAVAPRGEEPAPSTVTPRTHLMYPLKGHSRTLAQTTFPNATSVCSLYHFLLNKGYVDELYDEAIVQPIKALSEGALWRGLDATIIDGAVNGAGTLVAETGASVRRLQTGSMRAYAVSVLVGIVTIIGYYLWR